MTWGDVGRDLPPSYNRSHPFLSGVRGGGASAPSHLEYQEDR